MDIVYILGSGSKWEDNELRYSLRSVEKHFPHRNVVIVGERPDWLDNIIHIAVSDSFPNWAGGKYKNVIQKIRAACEDDRVSEDFVLMNDDFFFLEDTKEILPYVLEGGLQKMIDKYEYRGGQYHNALIRTKTILKKLGVENPESYAVHYPIIYNKKNFLEMFNQLDWLGQPCSWRTVYGNMFKIGIIERQDTKISSTENLIDSLSEQKEFLSISDNVALDRRFRNWIKERFPEKSKYEINN